MLENSRLCWLAGWRCSHAGRVMPMQGEDEAQVWVETETDRAAEQETDPVLQGWHMQRGTYPERTAQGGLWLLHLYYLQLHLKRERERKQKGRRDKNRPILTLVSPCCISLKKKNGTERQAFGFCALGNPLCELLFSKPVLFQNKSLGQRKKMKRHQISLNF